MYDHAPYRVRQDIADLHARVLRHIASPGTWLTAERRLAIAAETRNALACSLCRARKEALSPYTVDGVHDGLGELPEHLVEMVHRIATDPGRIAEKWVSGILSGGVTEEEYVETVAVIAHALAVDTFTDALGIGRNALPDPVPGEPTRIRPKGAAKDIAWLPTVSYEAADDDLRAIYPGKLGDAPSAPHVRRAMSLVPAEVVSFFAINDVQYLPPAAMWTPDENPRTISKSQVELVAARVSSLNGCFY